MCNFCITEHNAGVLLRISPFKFNYDRAECRHGLQKPACLWQSLTWIWNNCMQPIFFHYDLAFKGCLWQYIFFLRVLSACFPMVSSIFHCVLFPARVFGYPNHRLFCLSVSMLPCLSYIPRIFCGFLPIPSWHVPSTLLQSLLLSSFRFSILSQGTVSFICQFVYMFSLNFYGGGCRSSVDEDFSDIMLCRCKYQ